MFTEPQIDHANVKLGKHDPVIDPRSLKMAKYLTPGLPAPPPIVDWTNNVTAWGAMANDQIGDCAIAAPGHHVMVWTSNNGNMKTISDPDIIAAYSAVSGYNPRNGANDNGCNMLQVLKFWQQTGIGGDKLSAYATVDFGNLTAIRQAVYLFAGVYIGVELPASAQGQNVWDVKGPLTGSNRPGSWGGHAIPIVAYDDQGNFYVITWGHLLRMTTAFFQAYCSEAYAPFSMDWLNSGKVAPNALDLAMLQADLQSLQV